MNERSWNTIETELRMAKAALAQRSPLYQRARFLKCRQSVDRLTAELRSHSEFQPRMTGSWRTDPRWDAETGRYIGNNPVTKE